MPGALENDLLVLLHDVARQMSTYANTKARILGVTRTQLIILGLLERQPDVSQSKLAEVAEVTPMTIARLVDCLEEFGLVERCTDPKNRRAWRLRLTPAAAPILRGMRRLRPKLHSTVTKGIDPSVLEVMALGLSLMKENVSGISLAEAKVATLGGCSVLRQGYGDRDGHRSICVEVSVHLLRPGHVHRVSRRFGHRHAGDGAARHYLQSVLDQYQRDRHQAPGPRHQRHGYTGDNRDCSRDFPNRVGILIGR
jgi:MarR family transcriptional regulator, transcriptional regulator for hemolysin